MKSSFASSICLNIPVSHKVKPTGKYDPVQQLWMHDNDHKAEPFQRTMVIYITNYNDPAKRDYDYSYKRDYGGF
jgi:hypothetical protein